MKHTIKTTIGIIAIALSSMTIAEAGERRGDRNYEKPRQERSHRQENRRKDWNRSSHRDNRFSERRHFKKQMRAERKARRHFRKHKRFDRHARRHFKAYERSRRHGWKRSHYRPYKKAYYRTGGYGTDYNTSYYSAPSHSSHVSVSSHHDARDVVPVLAGTLIGSAIANDASGGDPVATFGGAVFGAIVGNAIAHH